MYERSMAGRADKVWKKIPQRLLQHGKNTGWLNITKECQRLLIGNKRNAGHLLVVLHALPPPLVCSCVFLPIMSQSQAHELYSFNIFQPMIVLFDNEVVPKVSDEVLSSQLVHSQPNICRARSHLAIAVQMVVFANL